MPGDLIEPVVEIVAEVASAGLDAAASSRSGRGFGIILLVTLIVAIAVGVVIATSDDDPATKPTVTTQER